MADQLAQRLDRIDQFIADYRTRYLHATWELDATAAEAWMREVDRLLDLRTQVQRRAVIGAGQEA